MARTKGDAREGAAILLQGSLAIRASIHIVKKHSRQATLRLSTQIFDVKWLAIPPIFPEAVNFEIQRNSKIFT
jgi:hypothetical protein